MKTISLLLFYFISMTNFFGQQMICTKDIKNNTVDTNQTTAFENQKGKLRLPVDNFLKIDTILPQHFNCGLGARETFNILCRPKANAVSITQGTVSKIARLNDHWLVIIKHGNYLSVYNNLDTVFVTESQELVAGSNIGQVSASDNETYLEFQLWKDKTQISAREWFYYQ